MDFYTVVFKKSQDYWVALCLENGLVGQGRIQEEALNKLKEAVASFQAVYQADKSIYCQPIAIEELHEFLSLENSEPLAESFELRAVHA